MKKKRGMRNFGSSSFAVCALVAEFKARMIRFTSLLNIQRASRVVRNCISSPLFTQLASRFRGLVDSTLGRKATNLEAAISLASSVGFRQLASLTMLVELVFCAQVLIAVVLPPKKSLRVSRSARIHTKCFCSLHFFGPPHL